MSSMADDGFKIRVLKSKPKPPPAKAPLPGPVTYDIVSTSPLEIETDAGVSLIAEGSSLGKLTCKFGIDPVHIQDSPGRCANFNDDGEIVLDRPHKYNSEWFEEGTVIGSIVDTPKHLEPYWVNSTIERFSKLVLMETVN